MTLIGNEDSPIAASLPSLSPAFPSTLSGTVSASAVLQPSSASGGGGATVHHHNHNHVHHNSVNVNVSVNVSAERTAAGSSGGDGGRKKGVFWALEGKVRISDYLRAC